MFLFQDHIIKTFCASVDINKSFDMFQGHSWNFCGAGIRQACWYSNIRSTTVFLYLPFVLEHCRRFLLVITPLKKPRQMQLLPVVVFASDAKYVQYKLPLTDAGKSTIGGQLMYLTGMVDKRTLEKYEREAKEKNRETWYLSWCMDTNQEGNKIFTSCWHNIIWN